MKIISHRGNIIDKSILDENKPSYIDYAIHSGYDVEVDIRYINNDFYLGHDAPTYKVNEKWILERKSNLLFHCKDLSSILQFKCRQWNLNYFSHSADPYVLTSHGYVWVHDMSLNLNDKCIIPLITTEDVESYNAKIVHAICTDHVKFAAYNLSYKGLYSK